MPFFSIVVLTFNRRESLRKQIDFLLKIDSSDLEIIVVDNASEEPVEDIVALDRRSFVLRNEKNLGAIGRNRGMQIAKGEVIITLDDDVYGITSDHLEFLRELFSAKDIAAINFKVIEEGTGKIVNWCHPYEEHHFHDRQLNTTGISEGAVAFRRSALQLVGYYPEYFFISHEGLDLAIRLINAGWRIIYSPEIIVIHAFEMRGRPSWRRYYYDTRNLLWLVLRNYSLAYGLKKIIIGWGAMLIYSVRDGFLTYWFKAIYDSVAGARRAFSDRIPPTLSSQKVLRELEKNRPGFFIMFKKRIYKRGVKI